jgi:RNA polymerase sigma-70 factor (ECF subfamily)
MTPAGREGRVPAVAGARPSGGTVPDAELVRAFAAGERWAAEALYGRLAPRVFGLGRVMLGDPAQAEDLVQDTFVKAWHKAASYDPARGGLDTWVLLVARSLAVDAIRHRVLQQRTLAAHRAQPAGPAEPGPEGLAVTRDLADRARQAMGELSAGQRAALELAYFGGRTAAEVAELEGIPVGTAKTRIRTALLKLRTALEDHDEL